MGQSVRFDIGLCSHYESVEYEKVSVALASLAYYTAFLTAQLYLCMVLRLAVGHEKHHC